MSGMEDGIFKLMKLKAINKKGLALHEAALRNKSDLNPDHPDALLPPPPAKGLAGAPPLFRPAAPTPAFRPP